MSLLSSLFGDDENARRAAEADAKLRQLNDAAIASGRYDAATAAQIQKNYASQVTFNPAEQEKQIDEAFNEGLQDGANNVTGFVAGTFRFVGKALSAVLLGIPAWAWLLGAGVLWGYLGFPGLKSLKKKLA